MSIEEIQQAQEFFEVASVQNRYSVDNRSAEAVLDYCKTQGIAFIPWYPIGGGDMTGLNVIQKIADTHGTGVRQVALSWLLHHADNILLIPGTSKVAHLEDNMKAAELNLSPEEMAALDAISPTATAATRNEDSVSA